MILYVTGGIAFIIGFALNFWINRNRFYRRNMFGTQGFKSYERALVTTVAERIGKLIAIVLVLFGMFLILLQGFDDWTTRRHREKIKNESRGN